MWYSIFIYSFEIRFIEAVLHAVIYTFSFSPSRAPFWPEYCGYTICNILRFMVSTGCHPYAFRKANWSRNIVGKIFHKWIFYAFQDSSMLFSSSGIWDVWKTSHNVTRIPRRGSEVYTASRIPGYVTLHMSMHIYIYTKHLNAWVQIS